MASDQSMVAASGGVADAGGSRHRLGDRLTPRARAVGLGRRYSRFVGVAKLLLPVVALGLASLAVAWPNFQPDVAPVTLLPGSTSPDEARMINPRYVGVDDQQQPFSVTAATCTHCEPDAAIVELELPSGEYMLENGQVLTGSAATGRFDTARRQLLLEGDVEVVRDDGYRFRTSTAIVDLEDGRTFGDQPVAGSGPDGEINASGFQIEDNGNTVVFTGPAVMVIRSQSQASQ